MGGSGLHQNNIVLHVGKGKEDEGGLEAGSAWDGGGHFPRECLQRHAGGDLCCKRA